MTAGWSESFKSFFYSFIRYGDLIEFGGNSDLGSSCDN